MSAFPPGFAVIDVETTGLRATTDRILEIAIVRTDLAGTPIAELVTLVNPERSAGATHIHGLSAEDLEGAPRFAEIVGELFRFLEGAALVGHNVKFDASFLDAELVRAGLPFPRTPLVCTRELSMKHVPFLGDYRLSSCCRALGIATGQEHRALDDARAAAGLLAKFVADEAEAKRLAADVESIAGLEWPRIEVTGKLVARGEGAQKKAAEEARLGDVLSDLPQGTTGKNVERYLALVDEILEDRRVTDEEASKARALAEAEGLGLGDVLAAHQSLLVGVARAALAGDLAGGLGQADLSRAARLLGASEDDAARALEEARAGAPAPLPGASRPLRTGMSVCFSGDTTPPKDLLEWKAREAGLRVLTGVSKKLDALVVDDPYSITSKAQKARTLGTRVLVVPVFLSLLAELQRTDKP